MFTSYGGASSGFWQPFCRTTWTNLDCQPHCAGGKTQSRSQVSAFECTVVLCKRFPSGGESKLHQEKDSLRWVVCLWTSPSSHALLDAAVNQFTARDEHTNASRVHLEQGESAGRLDTPSGVSEAFQVDRRVAQGDPCSPLLFACSWNGFWLSGICKRCGWAFSSSQVFFINNHIWFMDDTIGIQVPWPR
eukprot:4134447-Amphidinium_carterae.1